VLRRTDPISRRKNLQSRKPPPTKAKFRPGEGGAHLRLHSVGPTPPAISFRPLPSRNRSRLLVTYSGPRITSGPTLTTHGVQAARPATPTTKGRSSLLVSALQDLEGVAACVDHRKTQDRGDPASEGFPALLDPDLQAQAQRSTRARRFEPWSGTWPPLTRFGARPYPWGVAAGNRATGSK
jgi:hypothetical protein